MTTRESINKILGFDFNYDECQTVWEFLLLWNLFENKIFDTEFNVHKAEEYSEFMDVNEEQVEDCFNFFKSHYTTETSINHKFESLKFRATDGKDEVAKVLIGGSSSTYDKVSSIIVIIYRLRCNLFHGIKDVRKLNQQKNLFEHANMFLIKCLGY